MKKGKKIVLIIVEGATDCTALEFIEHLNEDERIKFHIMNGDITSKNKVTTQNCIKEVNEHLKIFIKKNKLIKSDISRIIHILDTDGVYIPNDKILEDKNSNKFIYSENGILYKSKKDVINRNQKKREILEKLLSTCEINKIPYKIYYMSCNLEHVLHNELRNFTKEEKNELANKFSDRFYENEKEFIEFINNSNFKVEGDYKTTWNFIKKGLNSINRYSNFWLFFCDNY